MSTKLNSLYQQGFTLLEIVLVLFLMGLMASATLLLTENVEDQAKYDETQHRLAMIRTAIIGDTTRTINGRPEISGFASDMGRLPNCLRELLSQTNCADTANLPLWQQDLDSHVWSGWRGPYLVADNERTGEVHFRDGYGNSGTTTAIPSNDWQNSGWDFNINGWALTVFSRGFDANDAGDDVPRPDIDPVTLTVGDYPQLVREFDYQVTLGSDWQEVEIQLYSESATQIFIPQNSLRLKLNTPFEGTILGYLDNDLDTSNERDSSSIFSRTFPQIGVFVPAIDGGLAVENTESFAFDPDAILTANDTVTVTAATEITYTDKDSNIGQIRPPDTCSPSCTLTIPITNRVAKKGTSTVTTDGSPIDTLSFSGTGKVTLSLPFPTPLVANGFAKSTISVPAGSTLLASTLSLPLGATINLADNNAVLNGTDVILSDPTITVVGAIARADNTVTTGSGDTFTIPSNTPVTAGSTLVIPAASLMNIGEKSLTIVCELAGPEQGELFDGNCTDGNDNNTNPPKSLTLLPKNTLSINDSALEWGIQ